MVRCRAESTRALFVLSALVATACDSDKGGDDNGGPVDGSTFTEQLALLNCSSGQYAVFDGTDWICAAPVTDTVLSEAEVDAFVANNGYLTSFTETDPVFGQSAAAGVMATDVSNWNAAFGYGDHAATGYALASDLNDLSKAALTCSEGDIPKLNAGGAWYCGADERGVDTNPWDTVTGGINYAGGNVGIGTTASGTKLDLNGALSVRGMAAPAASPAGQGRIYFDSTANKFKVSENAEAYADLVGGGVDMVAACTAGMAHGDTTSLVIVDSTTPAARYFNNADNTAAFSVKVPSGGTGISSIVVYFREYSNTGDLFLRFRVGKVDVSTAGLIQTDFTDGFSSYTTSTTNFVQPITVPTGAYDGLTGIQENDVISVELFRNGANAADTYEQSFDVVVVLFTFN